MTPEEQAFPGTPIWNLELEARTLRDAIYGPCTQGNWDACRDQWLSPDNLRWLRANAKPK